MTINEYAIVSVSCNSNQLPFMAKRLFIKCGRAQRLEGQKSIGNSIRKKGGNE